MKIIPKLIGAVFCASTLLSGFVQAEEEINKRTFKVAFVQAKDHPHGLGAQKFAELVKQKSDGKMKVMVFASGTLGGDAQVISSIQGGTVDMAMVTPGLLTGINKGFGVFGLPFTFNNFEEVDAVLDGPLGQGLLDTLPNNGLIGLDYWDHGFRHVTNSKRPITKLEDLAGLKLRIMQIPSAVESFNRLGANAVPMSFTEIYTALETHTVDGQENPLASIEASKFYEVQRYLSLTGHFYDPLAVIFSKKVWDRLNERERTIVSEAAREAGLYERQVSRESSSKALAYLSTLDNMTVNEVSPAEIERMREHLKPTIEKYTEVFGAELVAELNKTLADIRSKN